MIINSLNSLSGSYDVFNTFHKIFSLKQLIVTDIHHMTSLFFSGSLHVINNVITTRVLSLSAGTSNIMTMSDRVNNAFSLQ